jgi:hypothetical protein
MATVVGAGSCLVSGLVMLAGRNAAVRVAAAHAGDATI